MMVCNFYFVSAVAISSAQSCQRITTGDLGRTNTSGLIAETVGNAVQLQQFRIVCEVTAGTRDWYTGVSVVAEYIVGSSSTSTRAQFEFSCITGNVWGTVNPQSLTTPPDTNIRFATLRRNCYVCVSPNAYGSSLPGTNHCLGTWS